MNSDGATEPEIEASLGAALGATGDAQEQALTDLNRALTANGWVTPAYEDFSYAGYNADKVARAGLRRDEQLPRPAGRPARELRSVGGRWPRQRPPTTTPG